MNRIETIAVLVDGGFYLRRAHVLFGEGALANYIDVQEVAGHATNIVQNATATASVSVTQTVNAIQSLPDSALSGEDKNALVGMLTTLQASEGEKKKAKLMEVVKWLGDKAVDASIAAIPIIASML